MLSILFVVAPVFLTIGAGYAAVRTRAFPATAVDGLMAFAVRFAAPALLFAAIYRLDLGAVFDWRLLTSFYTGALFCFVAAIALVAIGLALLGLDPVTAISGSVAALCNIGPGLGEVIGPAGYYGTLPPEAKWLLSFAMLFGRLEFLSVLVLLTRGFWLR